MSVKLTECGLVAQWHVDEAVVGEGAHGSQAGALLATTLSTGGDEETSVLAPEASLLPLLASPVPESLELGGEVSVTGRDTEEDTVELLEDRGVLKDGDIGSLGAGVHLLEDFLGKGLGDPVLLLDHVVLGVERGKVAIEGVLGYGMLWNIGRYILEELGVTTSLLDTLQLSIGLELQLVMLFSFSVPPGCSTAACMPRQCQHTSFLMWPYME